MKTFVTLFLFSSGFGALIGIAYFFIAHEEAAGTCLLGIMAGALAFAASYAIVAERNADLEGDHEDVAPESVAGEDLGIFTSESAWPILVAVCVMFMLCGVLWSPVLAGLALLGLLLCLWRLGAESARV